MLSSVLCPLSSAIAAPPDSVLATYEILKGGIKVGRIEETFTRDKDRYTITSTTRATGLLAIFRPGKIVYSSSGLVDDQGLHPLVFSDLREGEESKDRRAEFDWDAKQLTLIQQAQRTVAPLPDGTQDRISAMYQFMYLPLEKTDMLNFNMTNGNKLDIYNYRITPDQSVTVPLGTFKALYVASVPEAGVNRTEIWLAAEHAYLPCRMVITDPDGGKLTQVLTSFSIVK
ncbi:MAG: hypothetical protein A2V79_05130 [Betaproteobacteria bacterium RBG_16_56_24]|nr:MAG: hypothetical protein A2V79_05130 [Betaproteobacteria bacterium RBG_16_56_24]